MADEKRIDLGAELGSLGASEDLIADIKKAAGAEAVRIEAIQTKERKAAKVQASKKMYVVVAVVAALALIIVAAIATNRPEPSKIRRQTNMGVQPPTVRRVIPGAQAGRVAPPTYNPQGAAPPPINNNTPYEVPNPM